MRPSATLIRQAESGDSKGIQVAIQSGFAESFISMTPYGSEGMSAYIENLISFGDVGVDTTFVVAIHANRIIGAVELRLFPNTIVVNYICILPNVRSRGMGGTLLRESLQRIRERKHQSVALDVLATNQRAMDWYQRLGFGITGKVNWWTVTNEQAPSQGSAFISGYPQAQVTHETFGFSQFFLQTRKGRYVVGRLNDSWFRLTQPEMLSDMTAMSKLAQLDSGRGVLVLAPDSFSIDASEYEGIKAASTLRLEASVDHVLAQLSTTSGKTG